MQTKAVNELFAYWSRRRGSRDVPNRRDIEPADIGPVLPDTFILEHASRADPRFRLAGTRLCTFFGRELRGTAFDHLFAADIRNRVARITENVMAHRTPAILIATAYAPSGKRSAVEIALLPMTTSGSQADRVIGAFCPFDRPNPSDVPFRYVTLDQLQVLDPEKESALLSVRSTIDMPASIMAIRHHGIGETVRRVLHLRVFEGGKDN